VVEVEIMVRASWDDVRDGEGAMLGLMCRNCVVSVEYKADNANQKFVILRYRAFGVPKIFIHPAVEPDIVHLR
jgi:hypothetical protein